MFPAVQAAFGPFKVNSEGRINYMYCDGKGYVTTAVGNLLKDAAAAKKWAWRVRNTGALASPAQITDAFDACKAYYDETKAAGKGAPGYSRYKDKTTLHLPDEQIYAIVSTALGKFDGYARVGFGAIWDEFPADAQLAVLSMMWGLGSTKGIKKANRPLYNAICAGDFETATYHCTFKAQGNQAVRDWKNKAYRFMFSNAATTRAMGSDYAIVLWPDMWIYDLESDLAYQADWMETHAPGREGNTF